MNLLQLTEQVKLNEIKYGEFFWHASELYLLLKRETTESPDQGVFVLRVKTNSLQTFGCLSLKVYREDRSLILNVEKKPT